jgi:hypothetical protein
MELEKAVKSLQVKWLQLCCYVKKCLGISSTGDESLVLNQKGEWIVNGSGGGPFLRLAGGTMNPGASIFFGTGGQNISQGSFDNNTGGNNGISLNCAVGYELNWQGGHLCSYSSGGYQNIIFDSSIQLGISKGTIIDEFVTGYGDFLNPIITIGFDSQDSNIPIFQFKDGFQTTGKVFTSDTNGNASWQYVSQPESQVIYGDVNVGINSDDGFTRVRDGTYIANSTPNAYFCSVMIGTTNGFNDGIFEYAQDTKTGLTNVFGVGDTSTFGFGNSNTSLLGIVDTNTNFFSGFSSFKDVTSLMTTRFYTENDDYLSQISLDKDGIIIANTTKVGGHTRSFFVYGEDIGWNPIGDSSFNIKLPSNNPVAGQTLLSTDANTLVWGDIQAILALVPSYIDKTAAQAAGLTTGQTYYDETRNTYARIV